MTPPRSRPAPQLTWWRSVQPRLLSLVSAIGVAGMAGAVLGLWGFSRLADEVFENETLAFDRFVLLTLFKWHNPVLDRAMLLVTFLGEPAFLLVLTLALSTGLFLLSRRAEAVALAVAASGATALNFVLKTVFERARPALWERAVDVTTFSFPSGHAMVSLVVYGFIGYLLAARMKRSRFWVAAGTAVLIALIGFSRLYLGVHWPTDVAAGYAAGLVWLTTCSFGLRAWQDGFFKRTSKQ